MLTDGELVGVLTRPGLVAAMANGRMDDRVGEVMRRNCRTVDEHEMLDANFVRMQEENNLLLAVDRGNRVVGVVAPRNISECMMIQSALRGVVARSDVDSIFN